MPRTRNGTIAAGAAVLAATLVWSLAEPPWRGEAPQPAAHEALIVLSERIVPVGAPAWPEGARSAATPSRDAPPPISLAGPMEAEANQAPGRELRAALRVHDLATAKKLLARAEEPRDAVDALVDLVLHARDLVTQLMAVQLLASIPGEAASAALLRIAHEPSIALRARTQAVIDLGEQAGKGSVPDLVELLAADEREVRLAAFRALGLLGEPDALRPLESALWYEEDASVRRIGFEALAQLGTPEAVESLLFFLEQEEPAAAADREAVLWALGTVSDPEAVPELLDWVARAEDPALRAALIRGLGSSADPRAFDVLLDTVLESEGGDARNDAINGLGLIGDPRALPVLRDLEADADERERRFIRTAIQRIKPAET